MWVADIQNNFGLLERAVTHFDARFTLLVLRSISFMRKHIKPDLLAEVIVGTYSSSNQTAAFLLEAIGKSDAFEAASSKMDVDSDKPKAARELLPEVDTYLAILVQIYLYLYLSIKRENFSSPNFLSPPCLDRCRWVP